MEKRKQFSLQKSLVVLLLTFIIFVSGLLIGGYNNYHKLGVLVGLSNDLKLDIQTAELEFDLMDTLSCNFSSDLGLSQKLQNLADKLSYMESSLGIDDPRVIALKKQYFLLETKHWLLNEKKNSKCHNNNILNNSVILYFYNNGDDCSDCDLQGTALSYYHKSHKFASVYSFDGSMNDSIVSSLKLMYGISDIYPSTVINGELFEGLLSVNAIETIVKNQYNSQNRSVGEIISPN